MRVAPAQEQVARLQVAVNDAAPVRLRERRGDAGEQRHALVDGEHAATQVLLEVLAREPLHDEIRLAVLTHPVRDVADDARVVELGEQLGLAGESLRLPRLDMRLEQLHGDELAAELVAGAKDHAHAAGSDLDLQPEAVIQEVTG